MDDDYSVTGAELNFGHMTLSSVPTRKSAGVGRIIERGSFSVVPTVMSSQVLSVKTEELEEQWQLADRLLEVMERGGSDTNESLHTLSSTLSGLQRHCAALEELEIQHERKVQRVQAAQEELTASRGELADLEYANELLATQLERSKEALDDATRRHALMEGELEKTWTGMDTISDGLPVNEERGRHP